MISGFKRSRVLTGSRSVSLVFSERTRRAGLSASAELLVSHDAVVLFCRNGCTDARLTRLINITYLLTAYIVVCCASCLVISVFSVSPSISLIYGLASETSCAGSRHNMLPPLVILTFDLLTLKVVSDSRVTWATSVPILVFLGLSVLGLRPGVRDRQTSDSIIA